MQPHELLSDAQGGYRALLDNDLPSAQERFRQAPQSPFHLCGLGLVSFLEAVLGHEERDLSKALETLGKAEEAGTAAQAQSAASSLKQLDTSDLRPVFPQDTVYKLIVADAVLCQALVHILTESYLEFVKAGYKLNKAWKIFAAAQKQVFPQGVPEPHPTITSLPHLIQSVNATYAKRKEDPLSAQAEHSSSSASISSMLWSYTGGAVANAYSGGAAAASQPASGATTPAGGKKEPKKSLTLPGGISKKSSSAVAKLTGSLRHTASASAVPTLASSKLAPVAAIAEPSSLPGSRSSSKPPSRRSSVQEDPLDLSALAEALSKGPQVPLWKDDIMSEAVISGTSFGSGLFGLVFSLLPPKLRKLTSFMGYTNASRIASLNLLELSAKTAQDSHASFASLILISYYSATVLILGWQAQKQDTVDKCSELVATAQEQFPNGTLWMLHRARLSRMQNNTDESISILEGALASQGPAFRQAQALITLELARCYLASGKARSAAKSFEQMRRVSNWSHCAYAYYELGALVDIPSAEKSAGERARIDALFEELPSLMGKKRLMGEPPSEELLVTRKVAAYKAKHSRWVAASRLPPDSKPWQVIRVSPALEMMLLWNVHAHAPESTLKAQVAALSSLTPSPLSVPVPGSTRADLDTPDEIAVRDLALGAAQTRLGKLPEAKALLAHVLAMDKDIKDDTWVVPLAIVESAIVELHLAEAEERESLSTPTSRKEVWRGHLREADRLLLSVFEREFILKNRIESRCLMLRDEIHAKQVEMELV